jgi:hypothetical protein
MLVPSDESWDTQDSGTTYVALDLSRDYTTGTRVIVGLIIFPQDSILVGSLTLPFGAIS